MHIHVFVQARGQVRCLQLLCVLFFEKESSTEVGAYLIGLQWLTNRPQDPPVSDFPELGLSMHHISYIKVLSQCLLVELWLAWTFYIDQVSFASQWSAYIYLLSVGAKGHALLHLAFSHGCWRSDLKSSYCSPSTLPTEPVQSMSFWHCQRKPRLVRNCQKLVLLVSYKQGLQTAHFGTLFLALFLLEITWKVEALACFWNLPTFQNRSP